MRPTIISIFLAVLLGGCVASTINTTKCQSSPAEIGDIAVATFFNDELRGARSNGWTSIGLSKTKVSWESNKNSGDFIVKALERNNINAFKANYDKSILENIDRETEDEIVQEIAKLLGENIRNAKADTFIIVTQNSIDALGRQHSALRNFASMGLVGVLMGESAKKSGAYQPNYLLAVNVGFHEAMIGKSRCLLGFDMYLVDAKTNQILGKRSSAIGLQEISSDVWGENITEYSSLDGDKIKDACINALDKGVTKSLMDIGLIPSVELQAHNIN